MVESFIPQMEPWFDESEASALFNYIKSGGWVTEFKKTREFEEQIRKYVGAKYCSIVSNGTISLTLALLASGVGQNDDVIVPDYTMVASANAAVLAGANVVFTDINPQTLCLDLPNIKKAVTPRTKAVILVTINGRYPHDLENIVSFCEKTGIVLIEDAAQSLGSFKDGKHLGTFGKIGSLSFAAPKIISTGQGGAVFTDDEEVMEKIKKMRDFGRSEGGSDHYLAMGWNFKFTDIQAIIGIEQMKKLLWRTERKKQIYALYESQLKNVDGVSFIPTNLKDTTPMFVDIFVSGDKRGDLVNYLKSKNIGTRIFYPALHSEPVYAREESHPVAEDVSKRGLWLPSSSKLTDEQIALICEEIKNFFKNK
jgi:perosamine synthetase